MIERDVKLLLRGLIPCWLACAACAPRSGEVRAADFPDDPPACIGDDDCVLSTFAGCCACPGAPQVRARVELAAEQQPCVKVDCAPPAPPCSPPPRSKVRGVACVRGRCVGR